MADGLDFDWDSENIKHLAEHKVGPAEFEQVLSNDPLDLEYEVMHNEDRYRSVGLTNGGRLLLVVYSVRNAKIRAVTAFPAGVADRKAFLERPR